jgi:hypothetical protein
MTTAPSHNLHAAPFHATRWTLVCLAKADSEGRKALADLCDAYYESVVAYLRNLSRDADATQERRRSLRPKLADSAAGHAHVPAN